jgi:hypothetical protein
MDGVRRPAVQRSPDPRGENQQFVKLRSMQCFGDVESMLRSGMQITQIRRLIQETFGEYTDVTAESLEWTLREYRKTMTPAEMVSSVLPSLFAKQVDRLDEGIDELNAMQELLEMQMGRIKSLTEVENKLKFPLRGLGQEYAVALSIMKARADLKMDLGLNGKERQLGRLSLDTQAVSARYGEQVTQGLQSTESRTKVTSLVNDVVKLRRREPDRSIVDAEVVEEGRKAG